MAKTINGKPNTIHQGALIETPSGEWWTIMQEDLGALGRMPNLQPVKWKDEWPVVGNNGVPYTTCDKPKTASAQPAVLYNLLGQRITAPAKGVYIYKGNKILK